MENKLHNNKYIYGYIAGYVSIVINILLFIIKFIVGQRISSVAFIADAWHTLSDSVTSIVVLVSLRIAKIPADKEHPFGHGRTELIGSIVIGVLLIVVGFHFFIESVAKFKNHEMVTYGLIPIIVMSVTVICKEGLAQFSIRIGKHLNSKSLVADGWHHRSDALSSVIIIAGILIGKYFWWIDSVLGIIVSIFIFFTAFSLLKETISPLIGENPNKELENKILDIIKNITNKTLNLHHLHMHRYGHHTEITFHIEFPKNIKLLDAHELATKIERALADELEIDATIHMEPEKIKGID